MSWVAGLLCVLFLLGGLRNRGRLERLTLLPPSDEPRFDAALPNNV